MLALVSESSICAPDAEYGLGRVSIVRAGRSALRSINTGADEAYGRCDFYDVIMPCEAPMSFCQGDRSGTVDPGEYIVLNRSGFYELSSEASLDHWRITIPATDMRGRLSSVDDHLGKRFEQDSRMAGLLSGLVSMIADTFSGETPPNPEAFATEIIGFIALVLGSETRKDGANGRNSRFRLKQRIFDYVEQNLADADLSPKQIAKSNRISLSYLYSLFSDNNTTVGQFIQARRLQRAYELLVADPRGSLTVSEIAYNVGFKNASHFSRTFSRHFRIAPRDARLSGLSQHGAQMRGQPLPQAAHGGGLSMSA